MKRSAKYMFVTALVCPVVLFLDATSNIPYAAETEQPAYTMTVISDAAYGRSVVRGNYELVIDRITAKRRSADPYADQTNLCVAYTKLGEVERASRACKAAVSTIRDSSGKPYSSSRPDAVEWRDRTYLALALSNLGVLHAVKGEPALAREKFEAALELKAGLAAPRVNLERLKNG